jgi:Flp pilus assembly pilin Flp
MKNLFTRLVADDQASNAVEYGVVAMFVALAIIGLATQYGTELGAMFNRLRAGVVSIH